MKPDLSRSRHAGDRSKITVMAALVVGVCVGWLLVQGMAAPSAESAAGQTIPTVTPATHNLPLIVYNPATPTPVCLPSPPLPSSDSANEARIAAGIQQQRSAAGLALLQSQTTIEQSSRRHSRDMADHNLTSHIGSDGSDGGRRMAEACYAWAQWGEIIGWGFGGSTDAMINWWLNSPPHRATILSAAYTDFGVGYMVQPGSEWGHYWTVDFGRPAAAHTTEMSYLCRYETSGPDGGSILTFVSAEPCPE
ncbi:MAG: CAP domain-containing protein [Anaerolineae bacterium]|nr:CAP domain-containing protein [Anaerolineae bacterium]